MTNVNLIYGNYAAIRQPELQCACRLIHLPPNSYIQMKLSLKKKKQYTNRDLCTIQTDKALLQAWTLNVCNTHEHTACTYNILYICNNHNLNYELKSPISGPNSLEAICAGTRTVELQFNGFTNRMNVCLTHE